MLPPNFYNQGDQAIYSAGDFFIPQERFRAAPYTVNKPNNPDEVPAGIPTVYQSQGGGGGTYTGGISDLTTNFFDTTANRQDRLRSLNMPLEQKGVPGGDILMENLQGYVGKPDDYLGAFRKLPNNLQLMTIHAAQSIIFNKSLHQRITSGLPISVPVSGDLVGRVDEKGQLDVASCVTVDERTLPRITRNCQLGRLVTTGPLPESIFDSRTMPVAFDS